MPNGCLAAAASGEIPQDEPRRRITIYAIDFPREQRSTWRMTSKLVPALVNAMQILRFINHCDEPPGVSHIAQALGINPSTCFNILKTLVHERLLMFDPTSKRYTLGLGIVELAHGVLNAGYVPYIHPYLERIATTYDVTALLRSEEHTSELQSLMRISY